MIIENGTLKYITGATGGGLGANGKPVKREDVWSAAIPCNVRTNNRNNLGKKEGEAFIVASYIVLIDYRTGFNPGRVQLTDNEGREIGEFPVISIETLDSVNAIKLVV
jgi:hypothetical protein